jgi:hypothetical protein
MILHSDTVKVGQKMDFERTCRRSLSKGDLIPSILNFDTAILVQVP